MGEVYRFDDDDPNYFWDPSQTPERVAEEHLHQWWEHFWDKVSDAMWGAAGMVLAFVAIVVLGRLGGWLVEHFTGSLIGFIVVGAAIGWGWRER